MKIYVAAKYSRRFELRAVHERLVVAGHEPTSQWVHNAEESKGQQAAAEMDVEDVRRADAVLFVGEPTGSFNRGGGRWFELGLAYALGKRLVFVLAAGEHVGSKKWTDGHETVFTALPEMRTYSSLDEALRAEFGA